MKPIALVCLLFSTLAHATIYLTVSGANVRRARLALGDLHLIDGKANGSLAQEVTDQIRSDLEFANLFDFVDDSIVRTADTATPYSMMNYDNWSTTGAAFILRLGYRLDGKKLVLEALLYDLPGKKKIFGTRYEYPASQYPTLVHALSEDILKELTGERGLFFSRILMVCASHDRFSRYPSKDVYVISPDGRNLTRLTHDHTITTSPAWMNDGRHISYTQYQRMFRNGVRKEVIVLKKHDLFTGERQVLSSRDGINSGAAWTPDGKKAAVTMSFSGHPELYLMSPSGGNVEALSPEIHWKRLMGGGFEETEPDMYFEVEPSWSPDASHLVFSSKRSGRPMIYTLDLATREATQLTFAGQYNATPAWSPKGDKILFAAQRTGEGNFDIYMIDPDGNNLSRMTVGDAGGGRINSEKPSWAPTGRHFAYGNNEGGHYAVYVMTTDGNFKRRISPAGMDCTLPAWGPYEGK